MSVETVRRQHKVGSAVLEAIGLAKEQARQDTIQKVIQPYVAGREPEDEVPHQVRTSFRMMDELAANLGDAGLRGILADAIEDCYEGGGWAYLDDAHRAAVARDLANLRSPEGYWTLRWRKGKLEKNGNRVDALLLIWVNLLAGDSRYKGTEVCGFPSATSCITCRPSPATTHQVNSPSSLLYALEGTQWRWVCARCLDVRAQLETGRLLRPYPGRPQPTLKTEERRKSVLGEIVQGIHDCLVDRATVVSQRKMLDNLAGDRVERDQLDGGGGSR